MVRTPSQSSARSVGSRVMQASASLVRRPACGPGAPRRGAPTRASGVKRASASVRAAATSVHAQSVAEIHQKRGDGLTPSGLGVELSGVDVRSWTFEERRANITRALRDSNGLVLVRGMKGMTPREMVELSRAVGDGEVERNPGVDPKYLIDDWPEVQRIGNVRGPDGELRAMFSRAPPLPIGEDGNPTLRYDPEMRSPVWHTDQAFRSPPPFASLLYCHVAPPAGSGAATAFADMTAALSGLPAEKQAHLATLRAVCSYAHHNAKVRLRTPTYPLLTPEQRRAHPPVYQPIVFTDPATGARSLYGFSSSVCAVVPEGATLDEATLDACELDAHEEPSVRALMYDELLPWATRDEFVYCHEWEEGDLVLWDNLRTIHTATPFNAENHSREMWRTTVQSRPPMHTGDDEER